MKEIGRSIYGRLVSAKIDWNLLAFLVLFLNVKLFVKLLALVIYCFAHRKHPWKKMLTANKLLRFYYLMMAFAFLQLAIQPRSINILFLASFATGMFFWAMAAIACAQVFLFAEVRDAGQLRRTVSLFFVVNALVTFATLLLICLETGAVNPYTFQGLYQKYFINTGDYMRGLSFDTSTTNALINAFAVIFFIHHKKALPTILCMGALLLAASNFTNLLLMVALATRFISRTSADRKSLVSICFFMLVLFMAKISPQNNAYAVGIFRNFGSSDAPGSLQERTSQTDTYFSDPEKVRIARRHVDSLVRASHAVSVPEVSMSNTPLAVPDPNSLSGTVRPDVPGADIHSKPFQRKRDTTAFQKQLLQLAAKNKQADSRLPGKVVSFRQTLQFLQARPYRWFTGNGMGNFSSKLAFRTTALGISGGYPERLKYINEDFKRNHLSVFLNFFSRDAQLHSIIHSPNSVYNQLLGEYGLTGLLIFVVLYAGYIWKRRHMLTYTAPMVLLLAGAFCVDYWLEQLSIVVHFELLLFININESREKQAQHE